MGIWRSNHSVGNMIGSLVAAAFVEYNWGLSFIVPAVITIGVGLLLFVFLVPDPRAVGCALPDHSVHHQVSHSIFKGKLLEAHLLCSTG